MAREVQTAFGSKPLRASVFLADFVVIAAEAVMVASHGQVFAEDSGRRTINLKSQFKFGCTTNCI